MIAAILGAGSMLGRELARQLRADGIEVLRIGRGADDDVRMVLGEPLAADAGRGRRCDVLFHCAAAFGGNDADGVRENLAMNALGCADVLELMDRLQCAHAVYAGSVSSCVGFDPDGLSSYGLSKTHAEQTLEWGMARRGGRSCSIRLPQLYDTQGDCCRHQPWFGRIVAYASRGLDLHLPPGGAARNFHHVEDAARLLARAAATQLTGTWIGSHPRSLSLEQMAALAYEQFGRGGRVVTDATKVPMRAVAFPDGAPLHARLGSPPPIDMAEGFARIVGAGTAGNFGPLDLR
jgi:nucleoside-diphosphate-sugar epimerase